MRTRARWYHASLTGLYRLRYRSRGFRLQEEDQDLVASAFRRKISVRSCAWMKIAVVGSGYVGLVAGACLAENGNDVICVDKDPAKVRTLQRGKIPIYEPGLEEMVRRNRVEKRLTFTTDLARGAKSSQIVFIAVGTPTGEDGSADLQHVLSVARDLGRAMNGYKVIVNKSTVPVGTAARVRQAIAEETRQPFSVVSNPEFLKQGAAIDDFMKPDRVVDRKSTRLNSSH